MVGVQFLYIHALCIVRSVAMYDPHLQCNMIHLTHWALGNCTSNFQTNFIILCQYLHTRHGGYSLWILRKDLKSVDGHNYAKTNKDYISTLGAISKLRMTGYGIIICCHGGSHPLRLQKLYDDCSVLYWFLAHSLLFITLLRPFYGK